MVVDLKPSLVKRAGFPPLLVRTCSCSPSPLLLWWSERSRLSSSASGILQFFTLSRDIGTVQLMVTLSNKRETGSLEGKICNTGISEARLRIFMDWKGHDNAIFTLKQCCGSGCGIRCLLAPGSGIRDGQKIKIRIRDEHPGSYFRELSNNFWVKKLFILVPHKKKKSKYVVSNVFEDVWIELFQNDRACNLNPLIQIQQLKVLPIYLNLGWVLTVLKFSLLQNLYKQSDEASCFDFEPQLALEFPVCCLI